MISLLFSWSLVDTDLLFLEYICKIMIVVGIVHKQRMLISDVIMENPFVNSAVIGLSSGEIVRFTS